MAVEIRRGTVPHSQIGTLNGKLGAADQELATKDEEIVQQQREASRRASGSRKNPRASTVGSFGPRKRKVL